uniref:Hydroxyproline-rich glycoprotein family protein n=1 Tax=Salix viminalis TaxID=40686 RepID=A0A6N2K0A7_SALVM
MRGVDGESRAANNSFETISAAATAIASADSREPQATVQFLGATSKQIRMDRKRRWRSRWSIYWCFGYQNRKRQIGHAVHFPEPPAPGSGAPAGENSARAVTFPFAAPPSSPASFFQSEPPSVTQSPAGSVSLTSVSASMHSPSGPASIFVIGPYAYETQLVSPPVFSTFTTEPSTASFTPPPESVHLTTPSSPEVPFAQFLDSALRNGFHPGSPVGQLISPSSGISGSGTSSPFPDGEFAVGGPHFPEFRMDRPPLFLHRQFSDVASHPQSENGHNDDQIVNHRVSFELTAEDASRCVEEKAACSIQTVPVYVEMGTKAKEEESYGELIQSFERKSGDTPETASTDGEEAPQHRKQQSITLGCSVKEFNFDNADEGDSHKPSSSSWWANGSVVGKEGETTKNWSFFPTAPSGVS